MLGSGCKDQQKKRAHELCFCAMRVGCAGPEDCCAFGDGNNDIEMLDWAGWSISPSNGTEVRHVLAYSCSRD